MQDDYDELDDNFGNRPIKIYSKQF